MRLLHTSDWHLGRSLHRADLRAAQSAFLDHLVDVARAEKVDAILVAGDIYDRAVPPVDAVELCEDALLRLHDTGASIVLISGNHDSARRLGFGGGLLEKAGVHLRTRPGALARPVVLGDAHGPVAVYGVPYLEPDAVRGELPPAGGSQDGAGGRSGEVRHGHAGVLGHAVACIRADAEARGIQRRVVMAHGWVSGGAASESERDITVGGVGQVPAELFAGFGYVALGHLHGQQTVAPHLRYSGSPLPYSFSEASHRKGSWLVELDGAGTAHVEQVPAPAGRRLSVLRGRLADLLGSTAYRQHEDDFVSVTLTDPSRPEGAMDALRARFPHVLVLAHQPEGAGPDGRGYRARTAGREDLSIAAEFVRHVSNAPPTAAEERLLASAFAAVRADEAPLMRPHRLRVTAFGAFGGTVQVSFDDLAFSGLFLLHGETGAGKTTLLDAIGFALYGRVPGERGKVRRLRSDHAAPGTPTEVQLEATLGGRRMRITRKPEQERAKLRGAGTTTEQAKVLLEEFTGASWHAVSTRMGEADAEIADLMGMSADQFFQVVLLPQGEFARFLHADAGDRAKLLQRLFGTDRFHAVEEWLARRRKATADEVREAELGISGLLARVAQVAGVSLPGGDAPGSDAPGSDAPGSDAPGGDAPGSDAPGGDAPGRYAAPAQWAAQLAETAATAAEACRSQVAACRQDLDRALDGQREAGHLADRQRRRAEALRTRDNLAAAEAGLGQRRAELAAATRAADVAHALTEAERTGTALAQARAAEEQARRDAGAAPGATATELRAAAEEHVTQLGRLETLRSVSRQAADEDQAAEAARAAAVTLSAQIDAAAAELAARQRERPELSRERDQAAEAGQQLAAAQAEADRYSRAADDAAALVQARTDAARQEQAYFTTKMEYLELFEDASRLRRARIDGMRAELAATLVHGTPCPVCGSLDHPELCELRGDRVTREQEEAADAEAAQASERAEMIGAKLGAADVRVTDLSARLRDAGFAIAADLESLRADAARLEGAARERQAETGLLAAAAARRGELQAVLETLDQAIAATEKHLAELTEQRESGLRQAAAAGQRADRHRESLLARLGGQPDLDAALSAARQAANALIAAADGADATARAGTDAMRAGDVAARAAAEAGFADLDAARRARREAAWRAEADRAIREHEASSLAVADLLADPDLDVPLDPLADLAGARRLVEAAREADDDAVAAYDRAQHRVEQLADLAPQLTARLDDLKPLAGQAAEAKRLADLAAGLGANTLRMTLSSFVLAARLEEVAAAASERLLKMTSGRYSLVHTDARRGAGRSGLGLLACDGWTGVDRDTSTLSGGETFLASLALALGLADVVTAEAGGTRIEALFVDEGFGSLDEDTLEEVMTVLDGLREGGRMVGIVSHVAELRQRIPAQVRVRKGQAGSHLTVSTGSG